MSDLIDDRTGKPKTPEQAAAELFECISSQKEAITLNFMRMLVVARCNGSKEECEGHETGLTELFTELSPELGLWARKCIRWAREHHEATL